MNMLDRIIGYLSPEAGMRRANARASLQQIQKLTGSGTGPYDAAKINRLNLLQRSIVKENEVSGSSLDYLRAESWNLYRNNPSARKIVRNLEAKVIGKGMSPESLATLPDGTPHVEFRARAKQLWASLESGFDARGLPGKGGLTLTGLQKLALRSAILSGETLSRLRPISPEKQRAHDLPIAVAIQLVDPCRLADESEIPAGRIASGNTVFRGIELNAQNERVAYWLRVQPAYAPGNAIGEVKRFPLNELCHLFIEEDIDQLRGVPWFSAAILQMRSTADLQHNVLKATAMGACVVGTYSKPTGATRFGLNSSGTSSTSADGTDLTDADGNAITKIQPGMLINTGKDGAFELHSPNQPNMNPEGFVQHLQRGTATAFPGIKASTITGDYRNSSFSSERSADNDTWPELHDLQSWFAASFCQPVYETVLRNAVMSGYFEGIVTAEEFQASPGRFSSAKWQGPVALSINPKDDAESATLRIKAGLSSPQMECAKVNVNWRDVLNDIAELYEVAEEKDIPEEVVNNIMGVDASDIVPEEIEAPTESETGTADVTSSAEAETSSAEAD